MHLDTFVPSLCGKRLIDGCEFLVGKSKNYKKNIEKCDFSKSGNIFMTDNIPLKLKKKTFWSQTYISHLNTCRQKLSGRFQDYS